MEDLRLSTTTYSNSLNRLQEAQQEKKPTETQKDVQKEAAASDVKEPIQLSISEEGRRTLNDSKDGSVAAKEKNDSRVVSFSRNSRMEDFSLDTEEADKADTKDSEDSSKIKDLIKEEKDAAEKRADLIKKMNSSDEKNTAETESGKEKPPVTNFAGMTSAQIKTLYQQGRISYQTYMSKTEAKEEALKEQISGINDTQADIVGLEAIKNQLLNGMPDQIKAEIA